VHGLQQTYHRLKIILDEPDGTPRLGGSSAGCLGPFGDGAKLDAR
jgi:hypothetical protein